MDFNPLIIVIAILVLLSVISIGFRQELLNLFIDSVEAPITTPVDEVFKVLG